MGLPDVTGMAGMAGPRCRQALCFGAVVMTLSTTDTSLAESRSVAAECCLASYEGADAIAELARHFDGVEALNMRHGLHAQNGFQDKIANTRLSVTQQDLPALLDVLGLDGPPYRATTAKRDLVGVTWWRPMDLSKLRGGTCASQIFRYCWVGFDDDPATKDQIVVYTLQYSFPLDFIDHID